MKTKSSQGKANNYSRKQVAHADDARTVTTAVTEPGGHGGMRPTAGIAGPPDPMANEVEIAAGLPNSAQSPEVMTVMLVVLAWRIP
jgi:hypothetical protein